MSQQEQYSRAWELIDKMSKFRCTVKERNELQEIIELLLTDGTLSDSDREKFTYWKGRYALDIGTIVHTVQSKILEQKAIIEIANRRISELEKQLEI